MDGIILIDKPSGWTSFDVVAKIRGILASYQYSVFRNPSTQITDNRIQNTYSRKVKVGHTGTLDPLATGLLILVLGTYCKRAQEFSKLDKVYEVTMKLGETSTTGDAEGVKTVSSEQRAVSKEQLQQVLEQFVGEIKQVPPAFSAIKVNGQRAYKLAREGKEVKLQPRIITIHAIALNVMNYPEVQFTANVSSGTYIRSLVEDIGKALGTGAYMSDLRRTSVGNWDINNAINMTDLSAQTLAKNLITQ